MDKIEGSKKHLEACLALMKARDLKYGDSWKCARITSLADYVLMKYNRISKMSEQPSVNKEKLQSDLYDTINYSLFILNKLDEGVE